MSTETTPIEGPQELIVRSQEAMQLFRSFSFELESKNNDELPQSELTLAVVEERKRNDEREKSLSELRKHFEPCAISKEPEIAKLDVESNELTKAWALLREKLPSDLQIKFTQRPQEMEDVIGLTRQIENEWQAEKRKGISGRAKTSFRKMCSVLGSHSNLLQILPSSSQYTSVFCGTLQTLIQASMNYEKIAEGLSRALEEISEAVDACAKDCALYRTQAMQYSIANLYAHIFFFLRNTIDWYMRKSIKRALSSLKEDFYVRFEDEILNIKRISLAISRDAQHGSHSELRYTRMVLENLKESTVIGFQDLKREAAERIYREERAAEEWAREREAMRVLEMERIRRFDDLQRLIGQSAKALLMEGATAFVSEGSRKLKPRQVLASSGPISSSKDLIGYTETDDLQYYSRHLEDSMVHGQIRIQYDPSVGLFSDWQVVAALQEWSTSDSSQIINVVGPSLIKETSPTAPIASHCIDLAIQSGIPVISFFCELPQRGTSLSDGESPEMRALISLTYALIRQIVELVPPGMNEHPDSLNRRSFERLDGCSETMEDALDVLGQLLDQSPPVLLCIIDGLQKLDDRETRQHLKLLLETLRGRRRAEYTEAASSEHLLKILFTTDGRSRCLLNDLSSSELVFAERSSTSRLVRGTGTPGRLPLSQSLLAKLNR